MNDEPVYRTAPATPGLLIIKVPVKMIGSKKIVELNYNVGQLVLISLTNSYCSF